MMLRAEWARGRRSFSILAIALAAACSFQDFEYLQEPAPSPSTGGTGAKGGSSGSSGSSGDGGTSGTAGTPSTGGAETTGGSGGEGDAGGEGGAGSSAGGSAGTSGSGGSGVGGTLAGSGGMAGGGSGGKAGSGGMGAVGQLVNPSFETSNTNGWTVDPPSALTSRYAYVQYPTGTVPAPDGSYELSTWHMTDDFIVEIYQRVTGLEDGTYTFQGYFSRGDGFNEAYMFARNCSETDPDPVLIPVTDPSAFEVIRITGIEVTGGSCEVGLYVDSNLGNWLNADKFTLEPE